MQILEIGNWIQIETYDRKLHHWPPIARNKPNPLIVQRGDSDRAGHFVMCCFGACARSWVRSPAGGRYAIFQTFPKKHHARSESPPCNVAQFSVSYFSYELPGCSECHVIWCSINIQGSLRREVHQDWGCALHQHRIHRGEPDECAAGTMRAGTFMTLIINHYRNSFGLYSDSD